MKLSTLIMILCWVLIGIGVSFWAFAPIDMFTNLNLWIFGGMFVIGFLIAIIMMVFPFITSKEKGK